jgi:hypothetical protein
MLLFVASVAKRDQVAIAVFPRFPIINVNVVMNIEPVAHCSSAATYVFIALEYPQALLISLLGFTGILDVRIRPSVA